MNFFSSQYSYIWIFFKISFGYCFFKNDLIDIIFLKFLYIDHRYVLWMFRTPIQQIHSVNWTLSNLAIWTNMIVKLYKYIFLKSSPKFCCRLVIRVPIIAGLECQGHSQVSDGLLMTVKMKNSEFGNSNIFFFFFIFYKIYQFLSPAAF